MEAAATAAASAAMRRNEVGRARVGSMMGSPAERQCTAERPARVSDATIVAAARAVTRYNHLSTSEYHCNASNDTFNPRHRRPGARMTSLDTALIDRIGTLLRE